MHKGSEQQHNLLPIVVHCTGGSCCIIKGEDVVVFLPSMATNLKKKYKNNLVSGPAMTHPQLDQTELNKVLNKREWKLFFLSKKDWSTEYNDYCQ